MELLLLILAIGYALIMHVVIYKIIWEYFKIISIIENREHLGFHREFYKGNSMKNAISALPIFFTLHNYNIRPNKPFDQIEFKKHVKIRNKIVIILWFLILIPLLVGAIYLILIK